MIDTWRLLMPAARAAFFLGGLLLPATSAAQTVDFQIMVNGPWAYVVDPDPNQDPYPEGRRQTRIVIVAPDPSSGSHTAHAFLGTDATTYGQPGDVVEPATYHFDFPPNIRTLAGARKPTDWPPAAYTAPQEVAIADIIKILYDPSYKPDLPRVVISLPLPDYYSTHSGSAYSEVAESKMDYQHVTISTQPKDYTIWMVLHYEVLSSSLGQAGKFMTDIKSLIQGNFQQCINPNPNHSPPCGFSIVMAPKGHLSYRRCDSYSLEAFADSTELWGLEQYARFPEEADDVGTQNRGVYHWDCPEAPSSGLEQAQKAFEEALQPKHREEAQNNILAIRRDFSARFLQAATVSDTKPKKGGKKNESTRSDEFGKARKLITDEATGLGFGRLPASTMRELDCAQQINEVGLSATCIKDKENPGKAIESVLEQTSKMVATAAGGTDCHMAQMSINGAIF